MLHCYVQYFLGALYFWMPFCKLFLQILPSLSAFSIEFSSRVCLQYFFHFFFYSGFNMIYLLTNPYLCICKLSFDYIYKFHWILDLHTMQVQQTHYIQKLYSVCTFRTQGNLQLQEIQSTFWNGDTNSVPRASE